MLRVQILRSTHQIETKLNLRTKLKPVSKVKRFKR